MSTMLGNYIEMQAVNYQRNHHRYWRLDVTCDLLGALTVTINYGRIGAKGRELRAAQESEAAARSLVRRALARRHRANLRLGAPYQIVAESGLQDWLQEAKEMSQDGTPN
jgi:predicted DNA-binding WGR domain protein